jgi:poly(hydroxyalkanoate) granule-associated protein
MATRAKRKKKSTLSTVQHSLSQGDMLEAMHQVWLAGMGAVATARKQGPKMLDDLLAEGARIHDSSRKAADKAVRSALAEVQGMVGERMKTAQAQAGETLDNLEKIFQTRVHRVLNQLGVPSADEIQSLARRVDQLNRTVAQMPGAKPARRATKTRAKGSAAKRKTARSRRAA